MRLMAIMLMESIAVKEVARISGQSTASVRRAAMARDCYDEILDEVMLTDAELDLLFELNKQEDV